MSPDSRWVLSCSDDRSVRIWDARTAAWQCTLQGHNNEFLVATDFSPDGRHLVTGGQDSRVLLWKLECKAT
jgi:WD40 repeat protein